MKDRPCLSHAEIESVLAKAGIAPTAQRIAICKYVLCEADHPTAEEIKNWADRNFPKMSIATVYNTLGVLVGAGLLKELHLPHLGSAVYDDNVDRHFHFVDEANGKIHDIDPSKIQISKDLERQFEISQLDVVIRGRMR